MSAILSADDLNDFISPGVACIKPVETLPFQVPTDPLNPYEVTTEDRLAAAAPPPPAQISLTDCLACSGCVTSAEAVLISLQSHEEVLNTLNNHPSLLPDEVYDDTSDGRVFVASVSPQTRASLAALYNVSETEAGYMIAQLLSGPNGLRSGGRHNSGFTYIIDTNTLRSLCQAGCVEEVARSLSDAASGTAPKKPILASACPGWICYAEKTHPYVLPHISRLKSPQALAGALVKSVLARRFGINPSKVWHVALMPCFDKKLEASREELTDTYWQVEETSLTEKKPRGMRDTDCVITARELVMLADSRGISFPSLPRIRLDPRYTPAFSDPTLDTFLFRNPSSSLRSTSIAGPSGGYAYAILAASQRQHPGSAIVVERGRNIDVIEYSLRSGDEGNNIIMRAACYYGFRNIQNLVRRLKPVRKSRMPGARTVAARAVDKATEGQEYAYVEVMACPGGCTNGGGQVKVDDVQGLLPRQGEEKKKKAGPTEQREWLARVDEAYYSGDEEEPLSSDHESMDDDENTRASGEDAYAQRIMEHWSALTGVELGRLLYTTYRQVESDVGKKKSGTDMDRVAGLASSIGGGW